MNNIYRKIFFNDMLSDGVENSNREHVQCFIRKKILVKSSVTSQSTK